jgi:hypothetical protein
MKNPVEFVILAAVPAHDAHGNAIGFEAAEAWSGTDIEVARRTLPLVRAEFADPGAMIREYRNGTAVRDFE